MNCPETDVAPRVVTTDAAVDIVDHVETPFFATHFLSWPTSEVETPVSLTTSLATHSVGGGCAANGACTSIPTIKTSSTGVAHACGELSYSLGVSLHSETSTCDYVIPRSRGDRAGCLPLHTFLPVQTRRCAGWRIRVVRAGRKCGGFN